MHHDPNPGNNTLGVSRKAGKDGDDAAENGSGPDFIEYIQPGPDTPVIWKEGEEKAERT